MKLPIALQLYTVRDALDADFVGTLERVSQMGYEAVEFFGDFYDRISAPELRAVLDRLGLVSVGSTLSQKQFGEGLEGVIDYHARIGSRFLSIGARLESEREWMDYARAADGVGQRCAERGIVLCYHNHDHEFRAFGARTAMDILLDGASPGNLKLELDTYWAQYAGVDPMAYISRHGGRLALVHQKDMRASDRGFCEIGEGVMDIRGLYRQALELGVAWFILEQDKCEGPSLESAARNLQNMRKLMA